MNSQTALVLSLPSWPATVFTPTPKAAKCLLDFVLRSGLPAGTSVDFALGIAPGFYRCTLAAPSNFSVNAATPGS
jgi:hypothetical protein